MSDRLRDFHQWIAAFSLVSLTLTLGCSFADAEGQSSRPTDPLIEAAKKCDLPRVRMLLKQGANVNAVNERGESALLWAVVGDCETPAIAHLLLDYGANPNIHPKKGYTILAGAIYSRANSLSPIRVPYPDGLGAYLTRPKNPGWRWKAIPGKPDIVVRLLQRGADVNARDHLGGTAILTAASSDEIRDLRLLIEHGADLNVRAQNGETALWNAEDRHHINLINLCLLLAAGADARARNSQGEISLVRFYGRKALARFRKEGKRLLTMPLDRLPKPPSGDSGLDYR